MVMKSRNVVIIGGGPTGIEAAKRIAKLGHIPFLIEKEPHLGGHLSRWDRLFPYGQKADELLKELTSGMDNVKWFVDTHVTSINRIDKSYNVILNNGMTIIADALLLTTGFSLYQAEKKEEYGYGIYDKVITNADLEHYFSEGSDPRIEYPKSIGFVHCVGSRDEKAGNRQCSKVCCATAVKQACEIKEKFPNATVYCFYMDLRMFGRNYEDMYLQAQRKHGVIFVRGRVSEVSETQEGRLIVKAEDTLSGKPMRVSLDLLVLMAGMVQNPDNREFAKMLSVNLPEDGFFESADIFSAAGVSPRRGLFYAGTCTGPKTLPEAIAEGRSIALTIGDYLL